MVVIKTNSITTKNNNPKGRIPKYANPQIAYLAKLKSNARGKLRKKINTKIDNCEYNYKQENYLYQQGIVALADRCNFDYFFTGTYSETYASKRDREKRNNEITKKNAEYSLNNVLEEKKRLSLNAMIRKTNQFLDYLISEKYVYSAFFVFEQNKAGYHTHIAMDVNPQIFDVDNLMDKIWRVGINLTVPIDNQRKILNYMIKEISLDNLNTNLSWDFRNIPKSEKISIEESVRKLLQSSSERKYETDIIDIVGLKRVALSLS